jgi:hypothetical protein
MNMRLYLAYGALLLAAAVIVGIVWFARRGRRAYSREHGSNRKAKRKHARGRA